MRYVKRVILALSLTFLLSVYPVSAQGPVSISGGRDQRVLLQKEVDEAQAEFDAARAAAKTLYDRMKPIEDEYDRRDAAQKARIQLDQQYIGQLSDLQARFEDVKDSTCSNRDARTSDTCYYNPNDPVKVAGIQEYRRLDRQIADLARKAIENRRVINEEEVALDDMLKPEDIEEENAANARLATAKARLDAAKIALGNSSAQPSDAIKVVFMAASRFGGAGAGVVHAFTCIVIPVGQGIKEDCYGFYPKTQAVDVTFTSGSHLQRQSDGTWIEVGTSFRFSEKPSMNPDELVLFDASRSFFWRIPKSGQSMWGNNVTTLAPGLIVKTYSTDGSFISSIKGPGSVYSEFEKAPTRFANVAESVEIEINDQQRAAIIGELSNWQAANYSLTDNSCIDLVASLAKISGLKLPDRRTFQTPYDYLKALKTLNP